MNLHPKRIRDKHRLQRLLDRHLIEIAAAIIVQLLSHMLTHGVRL